MNKDKFIYEYQGETIGRDPETIGAKNYIAFGIPILKLIDVIRERCIDCKGNEIDIRKCSKIRCSSWPYRLGSDPFERPNKPHKKYDPTFRQSLSQYCIQCGTSYMAKRSDQKHCSSDCKRDHQYYVRMSK